MTDISRNMHGPAARKKIIDSLKRIAEEKLAQKGHLPHFCQKWETIASESTVLAPLAAQVIDVEVLDPAEILAALFEPDAIEIIAAKCKSAYWFWYLLARVDTRTLRINAAAISRAQARAKESMRDKRYGFDFIEPSPLVWQLKQLPTGFVLEMWHKGRLLCQNDGFSEFTVILNPILIDD